MLLYVSVARRISTVFYANEGDLDFFLLRVLLV
jgi:hypothetical protein